MRDPKNEYNPTQMPVTIIETALEAEFTQKSVSFLKEAIVRAIAESDSCILGLSGGSTPRPVYGALGKESFVDWSKVYIFLVDDRYVPADHPDSNQFLIRSTLLRHAPIPEGNIFFPDTSLPLDQCVTLYASHLKDLFAEKLPDIAILGMGDDGHIASLFPPVANDLMDDSRLVAHTTTDRFAVHDRITLTLNPILAANQHVFLLKGKEKKKVWEDMMASGEGSERWPGKAVVEQGRATVVAYW